jgi:hypothetical protein
MAPSRVGKRDENRDMECVRKNDPARPLVLPMAACAATSKHIYNSIKHMEPNQRDRRRR